MVELDRDQQRGRSRAWADLFRVAKSISNLGDLYTVLQMFVLGAHLKSKR